MPEKNFHKLSPYVTTETPAGELFPLAHFTYHCSNFSAPDPHLFY